MNESANAYRRNGFPSQDWNLPVGNRNAGHSGETETLYEKRNQTSSLTIWLHYSSPLRSSLSGSLYSRAFLP